MAGKKIERICEGCHQPFMARLNSVKRGYGYFCSHACSFRKYQWKGGRRIDDHGYVKIYDKNGRYRREHRVVMEQFIGRPLNPSEIIHHKNGDKTDNRIENLEITNKVAHSSHHIRERGNKKLGRWSRKHDQCIQCGNTTHKHCGNGICALCYGRNWRVNH